jgi:hypothetical protein
MESDRVSDEPTVGALFDLLWDTVADLLGPAATATMLRRAAARHPALAGLRIRQEDLAYRYDLPASWQRECEGESLAALQTLPQELQGLLIEMTGPVVVGRLARVAALRRLNLSTPEVET